MVLWCYIWKGKSWDYICYFWMEKSRYGTCYTGAIFGGKSPGTNYRCYFSQKSRGTVPSMVPYFFRGESPIPGARRKCILFCCYCCRIFGGESPDTVPSIPLLFLEGKVPSRGRGESSFYSAATATVFWRGKSPGGGTFYTGALF